MPGTHGSLPWPALRHWPALQFSSEGLMRDSTDPLMVAKVGPVLWASVLTSAIAVA